MANDWQICSSRVRHPSPVTFLGRRRGPGLLQPLEEIPLGPPTPQLKGGARRGLTRLLLFLLVRGGVGVVTPLHTSKAELPTLVKFPWTPTHGVMILGLEVDLRLQPLDLKGQQEGEVLRLPTRLLPDQWCTTLRPRPKAALPWTLTHGETRRKISGE